jgi:hypothetical protein
VATEASIGMSADGETRLKAKEEVFMYVMAAFMKQKYDLFRLYSLTSRMQWRGNRGDI